ncbi:hypothetical protein JTE90_001607 [Oedothorax gibbosus]|uniref:Uncharacterized protein n=1 Tax=Oedothorax gibbosus TaxID=931172 RepID=A0AAV6VN68_9ARAC|nr:hypothetical protein JTE90_001607 [Oedothorax gibbosus]
MVVEYESRKAALELTPRGMHYWASLLRRLKSIPSIVLSNVPLQSPRNNWQRSEGGWGTLIALTPQTDEKQSMWAPTRRPMNYSNEFKPNSIFHSAIGEDSEES